MTSAMYPGYEVPAGTRNREALRRRRALQTVQPVSVVGYELFGGLWTSSSPASASSRLKRATTAVAVVAHPGGLENLEPAASDSSASSSTPPLLDRIVSDVWAIAGSDDERGAAPGLVSRRRSFGYARATLDCASSAAAFLKQASAASR